MFVCLCVSLCVRYQIYRRICIRLLGDEKIMYFRVFFRNISYLLLLLQYSTYSVHVWYTHTHTEIDYIHNFFHHTNECISSVYI